ncbi:MAG: hypothetical protein QXW98_07520 [Candidatus Caldarchaeum sp.]
MKAARKTSLDGFLCKLVELSQRIDVLEQLDRQGGLVDREVELDELHIVQMWATDALRELQLFMDETWERMEADGSSRNLERLYRACGMVCEDLREIELADRCQEVLDAAKELKQHLPCMLKRAKRYVNRTNLA